MNQNETRLHYSRDVPARAYLYPELLVGRTLDNALLILALKPQCADAAGKLDLALGDLFEEARVIEEERDAGLDNGELGRLAGCYLDSSASQRIPVWGLGMRYKYGAPRPSLPSPSCARADRSTVQGLLKSLGINIDDLGALAGLLR